MKPWIELNGIRSDVYDLGVLSADVPILSDRTTDMARAGDRLRFLTSKSAVDEGLPINIRLAAQGDNKTAVKQQFNAAGQWLYGGQYLRIWSDPLRFYEGEFKDFSSVKMQTRRIGSIDLTFECNPPCGQKAIELTEGWVPSVGTPIPEQLTDTICTMKSVRTTAGKLSVIECGRIHPPALYMKITGSFASLVIGDTLTINEAPAGALYIDCDAMQCYTLSDGLRVNARHSGAFPTLPLDGRLSIGGTNINITIWLMVIERN